MPQGPDLPALLFDFDGTLVDSAPAITRSLNFLTAQYGVPSLEVAAVRQWVSLGGEAMLKGAFGSQLADLPQMLEVFRGILRDQKADPADLYPGTLAMLAGCKEAGYRIGICTNKREDIAVPYAKGLGLFPYIDAIFGGAEGRKLKPDPYLVDLLLERLGASRCEAVFVGDSEVDAQTAAAAGIPFILVTFGYPLRDLAAIPAAARIDSFAEFPAVLAAVLQAGGRPLDLQEPVTPSE